MRALRLSLPCTDERSLAEHYGRHLGSGGLFLATPQSAKSGEALRFELCDREGRALFSGEGSVIRAVAEGAEEPAGLLVRYTHLEGPARATLDRLLLLRDAVMGLGLASAVDPRSEGVNAPPPRATLALELGGTQARAALFREGKPAPVTLGPGATSMPAAVGLDEKGRLLLGNRARAQAGLDPMSAVASPLLLLALDPTKPRDAAALAHLPYPVREDDELGPVADLPQRSAPALELFAALAGELKNQAQTAAGQPLLEAALVCSPTHDPRVRHLLLEGLKRAGFAQGHLLEDALCVAATYGYDDDHLPPAPLLVVDWGGTALKLAVLAEVDGTLQVLAAGRKHDLGGTAIDARLAHMLLDPLEKELGGKLTDALCRQRVLDAAEGARVQLSARPQVQVRIPWVATASDGRPVDLDVTLQAEPVERSLGPALDQLLRAAGAVLESAGVEPNEVHEVLLAGGQLGWPKAQERLGSRFGGRVRSQPNLAGLAVAGAAKLLERRATRPGPGPARLSAAVSVLGSQGKLLKLFADQTPLPARAELKLKPSQGAGLLCPLVEGAATLGGAGYLGAARLPEAPGEALLEAQIDERGVVDVQLTCGASRSRTRLALRQAGPGVEASVFAQRALPGEPEVWAVPVERTAPARPPSSPGAAPARPVSSPGNPVARPATVPGNPVVRPKAGR